jgi:hypothetical protein
VTQYISCDLNVIRELLRKRLNVFQQLDEDFDQAQTQMQQLIRREAQVAPLFQTWE